MFGAALLAFIAGTAVLFFGALFFVGVIIAAASSGERAAISSQSVLQIDLSETVTEKPEPLALSSIDLRGMQLITSNSLLSVLRAIETAKSDPKIEGIYLSGADDPGFDSAQGEELRGALLDFRQSGKFVVAWSDYYSQLGYYVASAADVVGINPEGTFIWHGVSANMLFFKGLLDKLDVKAEVIRHGSYKSAVEPFISDRMSPENSLQMSALVGSVWNTMVDGIARTRGLDSVKLDRMATQLAIRSAAAARANGLVDSLMYRDQVMTLLGERVYGPPAKESADKGSAKKGATKNGAADRDTTGRAREVETPDLVPLDDYISQGSTGFAGLERTSRGSRNEIALLYADGEIVDGRGQRGQIGSGPFVDQIEELRKDKQVKGVVLRINSPGGSALAAENIWRALTLLQADKPLVVSIGGTAASGGYYIAAPADAIIAGRTSVTGSIGVFSLLFDVQTGLKNKLGITMDAARSNPSADMEMPLRPLTTAERDYMQYQIEQVYNAFVGHVAQGRNMSVAQVDKIAQGRIWSGEAAVDNGLCDGFGGLKSAIALTADRAGVAKDFSIREVVPSYGTFWEMLSSLWGGSDSGVSAQAARPVGAGLRGGVAGALADYAAALSMLATKGVQARMPYIIKIE